MAISHTAVPTVTKKIGPLVVATFNGKNAPVTKALEFAAKHEVLIRHWIYPPGNVGQAGFQEIITEYKQYEPRCDGILITDKRAVGIHSRDCPIVVIVDTEKMEWVICHAGRPAITPLQFGSGRHNHGIISKAVGLLLSRGSQPHNLQAYITAGICKKCFVHHRTQDAALLKPFFPEYKWAFDAETGWFDIKRIIHSQLTNMRISGNNISQDGLCTKEHAGLASHRGGDDPDKNNLVTVHFAP